MRAWSMAIVIACACYGLEASNLSPAVTLANETYAAKPTSVQSTYFRDAVGKWTHATNDASVYTVGSGIDVKTGSSALTLVPNAGATPYNTRVAFEGFMTFTAFRDGEEWEAISSDKRDAAALAMKMTAEKELRFTVWTFISPTWNSDVERGRWIDVSNAAIAMEENRQYSLKIEIDQTCRPPRARYAIDGNVLADANGETWFSSCPTHFTTDIAPDHVHSNTISKVGFVGNCHVGNFTISYQTQLTARASVNIARLGSAAPGGTLSPVVTAIEGQTVGTLSYQWYSTDATGIRRAIAGATDATYVTTASDVGGWVEVEVSDESGYAGSGRIWCSLIPVAYIDIDGGEWPDDGEYRGQAQTVGLYRPTYDASIYITGDPSQEAYTNCQYDGRMTIHVRGNSTAYQRKKPYKLKFDKKADPFGLGGGTKSKHWVLLANYNDDSNMRNKLFYDFSEKLGLVAMKSTWVDVVMNGEYIGLYLFCQQIRVAEERINIYEWDTGKIAENTVGIESLGFTDEDEEAIDSHLETNCLWMTTGEFTYKGTNFVLTATKKKGGTLDKNGNMLVYWKNWKEGDISGGYIFEPDAKKVSGVGYNPAESNFCQTNRTADGSVNIIHMSIGTPEYAFTNPDVRQWVWDYWAYLSQTWMSGTNYGPDGRHYTETCDFDTMLGYWLIHQIAGNGDSIQHSRYAYKDFGGKTYFGPAWDFDLVGRTVATVTNQTDGSFVFKTSGRGSWIPLGAPANYAGYWTADPYFSFKLREKYLAHREELADIVREGGLIDQYKVKLASSAAANDARWAMPFGFFGRGSDIGGVEHLRGYITNSVTWLDKQFASVGTILTSASATVGASNSTTAKNLRYVQDKNMVISFPDAIDRPSSPDIAANTGVADVQETLPLDGLRIRVTAPYSTATTLDVYLDGFSNSVQTVTAQSSEFTLPRSLFTRGKMHFLTFTARDSVGKRLGRNSALVTILSPGGVYILR